VAEATRSRLRFFQPTKICRREASAVFVESRPGGVLVFARTSVRAKLPRVIFPFVNSRALPPEEDHILAACDQALRLAPAEYPSTLPSSAKLLGAPEWHAFEHEAWPIGESIRRAFVKNPRLKKNDLLLSRVAQVATCRNLRRGRQSFILALGFAAARKYAPDLAPFLSDPDVDGQVLDTLIKMKAPGFAGKVRFLLNSDHTWIRRLAKKYVDRYPTESEKQRL